MQAAKTSRKKRIQHWLITRILVVLIRVTGSTTRLRSLNHEVLKSTLEEYGSVIIATWHQNIYFSVWLLRNQELTALITNNIDDEVIYDLFSLFGYQAVRDSTTRGCLFYTFDAADDLLCVDLGGPRTIKKKKPMLANEQNSPHVLPLYSIVLY